MLNPIEEAKFAKLKEDCRELGVPAPPEIFIGLQVKDRNGVLVFDDKQRGHSWTRNFYNLMFAYTSGVPTLPGSSFGAGYLTLKNTAGSFENTNWPYLVSSGYYGSTLGGVMGIRVGTGDTAFDEDHLTLAAAIAQGTGSGQLSHATGTAHSTAYTAGSKTWKTTGSRIFNNNSGGSITVKETGIYAWYSTTYFMVERTVLSPSVAVANGAQLTVTYEISMDFSAID